MLFDWISGLRKQSGFPEKSSSRYNGDRDHQWRPGTLLTLITNSND